MTPRVRLALVALALSVGIVAAIAAHAERAARPSGAAMVGLVEATGLSDLFLSSSSRWLRHPSVTERAAPLSDAPDGLDVDPAGLAIPPAPEPDAVRFGAVPEEGGAR
jgi:hypothetical protein